MHSTTAEILEALDEYRTHIAAHNRRALEIYVPWLESITPSEDDLEDMEDGRAEERKMDFLYQLIGSGAADHGVEKPRDILDRYDELCPLLCLDGTLVRPSDEAERAWARDRHFRTIEEELKKKALEDVRDTITVPAEMLVLAEHVDSLHGSGLMDWISEHQVTFWYGPEWHGSSYLAETVMTPDEIREGSSLGAEGWEVAAGVECGAGENATAWIAYCRKASTDPWEWRYFVERLEYRLDVFDTIPDLLRWYKTFREQSLVNLPEYEPQDIYNGNTVR
ncbi:hypothetical protein F4821DRAFT_26315 [Hypoxylon rubiginosum]|uniref:Uncharacterized protein n=1 Tax=Hypoxylon rubiginosum TaxID=110542 RepID=A0ACC0CLX3_9PEZI|nr:hypothetical protein F4821DRAFT_26315 [Hypoxylon rubiginosum]